jgi:hypothetical protein
MRPLQSTRRGKALNHDIQDREHHDKEDRHRDHHFEQCERS